MVSFELNVKLDNNLLNKARKWAPTELYSYRTQNSKRVIRLLVRKSIPESILSMVVSAILNEPLMVADTRKLANEGHYLPNILIEEESGLYAEAPLFVQKEHDQLFSGDEQFLAEYNEKDGSVSYRPLSKQEIKACVLSWAPVEKDSAEDIVQKVKLASMWISKERVAELLKELD